MSLIKSLTKVRFGYQVYLMHSSGLILILVIVNCVSNLARYYILAL